MKTNMVMAVIIGGICVSHVYAQPANPAAPAASPASWSYFDLSSLLAKASPDVPTPTSKLPAAKRAREFSPYLTAEENAELLKMLRDKTLTAALTRDEVLEAVKQREMDKSLPSLTFTALMDVVNSRWPHDPVVIAFFQEALASRGDEAIMDLLSPTPGVWDDSFTEPVVKLFESSAAAMVKARDVQVSSDLPKSYKYMLTMQRALQVLDRHYSSWSKDASIPPRLSRAILTAFPTLTKPDAGGPQPGSQEFSNAMSMLAQTHDRAMIAVLRPFLSNKTVDGNGVLSLKRTPLRVSEVAANDISYLLGNKTPMYGGMASGLASFPPGPYAEWDAWDQQNAALAKRLDDNPGLAK